ncbi:hypothetical protein ACHAXT_002100 [Thalassiosira profunda]
MHIAWLGNRARDMSDAGRGIRALLPSLRRQECHLAHGIQNEDCVREELAEKRCFAELLCPKEARRFYREPLRRGQGTGSCSSLVELFAFPENELALPDVVRKGDREHCRAVVHALAQCLSKRRVGRTALLDPRSS